MTPWHADVNRLRLRLASLTPPALRRATGSLAAVLVPILPPDLVLLTVRTDHLPRHAGQVSFPGGRSSPGDADLAATALRETQEEVGLAATDFEIGGRLDPVITSTAFAVQPFVGFWASDARALPVPSPHEVARIVLVPLGVLTDPACRTEREFQGRTSPQFTVPALDLAEGRQAGAVIWGATGRIVGQLVALLS